MTTEVMAVDPAEPDPSAIIRAAAEIAAGGLVAFPTETVYGLGGDATNADAVAKIFEAKGRPTTDPLIVHISHFGELEDVAVEPPAVARRLAERFWPGPLTLVLRRSDKIPSSVSAGLDTVAVRYPNHPVAIALMRASGKPIAAPSANRFSRPSPTRAEHVLADLRGRVRLVLDGGPTQVGVESTVVDCTCDLPEVLRPGGVTVEELRSVEPNIAYAPRQAESSQAVSSPGLLLKHYSPRAEVQLFEGPRGAVLTRILAEIDEVASQGKAAGLLAYTEDLVPLAGARIPSFDLGAAATPDVVARKLFEGLRWLDEQAVDVILVRSPSRESLGEAIWDRLYRAAEGRVIRVDD